MFDNNFADIKARMDSVINPEKINNLFNEHYE